MRSIHNSFEHGSNSSVIVTFWNRSEHCWIWCWCKGLKLSQLKFQIYLHFFCRVQLNISWGSSRPFTDSMAIPGCIWQGWLRFHLASHKARQYGKVVNHQGMVGNCIRLLGFLHFGRRFWDSCARFWSVGISECAPERGPLRKKNIEHVLSQKLCFK